MAALAIFFGTLIGILIMAVTILISRVDRLEDDVFGKYEDEHEGQHEC